MLLCMMRDLTVVCVGCVCKFTEVQARSGHIWNMFADSQRLFPIETVFLCIHYCSACCNVNLNSALVTGCTLVEGQGPVVKVALLRKTRRAIMTLPRLMFAIHSQAQKYDKSATIARELSDNCRTSVIVEVSLHRRRQRREYCGIRRHGGG